ncbi:hypothetical protein LIER_03136 [Lithospermum erythrorhizon]|uniref:Transcription factor GTE1 n=1 Tax=Lithospermum erythrorhizon TaxID=34254 RepID=A0AAV3NS22_LITER
MVNILLPLLNILLYPLNHSLPFYSKKFGILHQEQMGTSEALFENSREDEIVDSEVKNIKEDVDEVCNKVNQLELTMNEVEQFYSVANKKHRNTLKASSLWKDKEKEKQSASFKTRQQDSICLETDASKRMQALTSEFSEILSDITQHKWAGPFLQPVDVVGLELDDYYEVIEKPMDIGTIKAKMEAKDGSGYKNVREICSDVRLVFKNAIKYNDEKDDVHVMAQTLLKRFEEKWLKLLPKVDEEERRQREEEKKAQLDIQLAEEAAHAKKVRELRVELDAVDRNLDQLRDMAFQKCRKVSVDEKKRLANALGSLTPEELGHALEIVSQDYPTFETSGEEVELGLDHLSHSTLWKLKLFAKETLLQREKSNASLQRNKNTNVNCNNQNGNTNKRRRSDTEMKTFRKRSRKPSN